MSYALKTKLRRLTAALTAFVLAFSLAPATAFADWEGFTDSNNQAITGSLTVSDVSADYHDIYVYQVAKVELNDTTNATRWVAVTSVGGEGTTADSGDLYNAVSAWIDDNSTAKADDLKALLRSNGSNTSLGSAVLVASYVDGSENGMSVSGTTATVSNLDPGIYVVLVENNSKVGDDNDYYTYTYQTMVLSINVEADGTSSWKLAEDGKNASTLKAAQTSMEKELLIDTTKDYYESKDELTFQVEVTLPTSASTTSYFYVEDLLTGLTYSGDSYLQVSSTKAENDNGSLTNVTPISSGYTAYTNKDTHDATHNVSGDDTDHSFNTTAGTGQQVLHIDFDSDFISTYAGQTIYIIYKAEISDYGIANGAKNEVTSSTITGSGNTNPGGGGGVTVSYALEVLAYYYASDEDRTAENQTVLGDATFAVYTETVYEDSLSTDLTTQVTSSSLYNSSTGWDTTNALVIAANNGKTITTGTDGKATTTYALKANTEYYVVETVVPSGYIMPTLGTSFTINPDDTTNFTSGSNVWSISVEHTKSGSGGDDGTGINLPMTGGLGTILLTAVGVLIIAAGACYTLRARKQQRRQQG